MKICIMSGAVKNAGDFLITERCEKIVHKIYPNSEMIRVIRNFPIDKQLDMINTCDLMIFAGGPGYRENIYPDTIPLTKKLEMIKPPMAYVGGGMGSWKMGHLEESLNKNPYHFTDRTREFLDRITQDTGILGCRDWYTVRLLAANGYSNAVMTGCPAWYDLSMINTNQLSNSSGGIEKICVSDPALPQFHGEQSIELLDYLIRKYPKAKITYVVHRGNIKDNFTDESTAFASNNIIKQINKKFSDRVKIQDISFSEEGFRVYDSCQLHIGYRVHAHIYNLSRRNQSILLEEDIRGTGVNQALGLWKISAEDGICMDNIYNKLRFKMRIEPKRYLNRDLMNQIDTYLNNIEFSEGMIFKSAFAIMNTYYGEIERHIKSLSKHL